MAGMTNATERRARRTAGRMDKMVVYKKRDFPTGGKPLNERDYNQLRRFCGAAHGTRTREVFRPLPWEGSAIATRRAPHIGLLSCWTYSSIARVLIGVNHQFEDSSLQIIFRTSSMVLPLNGSCIDMMVCSKLPVFLKILRTSSSSMTLGCVMLAAP